MYDAEGPTYGITIWPNARKPHRCCECSRAIEPGETHEHATGIWEGRWEQYRTCADCVNVRVDLERHELDAGEGIPFGRLWEAEAELRR